MREIKFRAWDIRANKMYKVDNIAFSSGWITVIDQAGTKVLGNKFGVMHKLGDDERVCLMQYTGLKDKNGVEIYEGDVVKVAGDWDGFGWWAGEQCPVVFEDGYFGLNDGWHKHAGYLHDVAGACEVIGNIYENPELLEKKHD